MRSSAGVVIVGGMLVVTLTSCVGTGTSVPTSTTSSPTVVPQPIGSSSAEPDAPVSDEPIAPDAGAVGDATAAAAAAVAVAAYCQPTRAKGEWIAALQPHLTAAAVVAYDTVDPASVPCTTITGPPSIRDGDDLYTFRINVPTDAGVYEAFVTRPDTAAGWLVDRMTPTQ